MLFRSVLDVGRIEEVGTHAELLKTSPVYQRLYAMQFHDHAEEVAGASR